MKTIAIIDGDNLIVKRLKSSNDIEQYMAKYFDSNVQWSIITSININLKVNQHE